MHPTVAMHWAYLLFPFLAVGHVLHLSSFPCTLAASVCRLDRWIPCGIAVALSLAIFGLTAAAISQKVEFIWLSFVVVQLSNCCEVGHMTFRVRDG